MTACAHRWREMNPSGLGLVWRECVLEKDHEPPHEYEIVALGESRRVAQQEELTGTELQAEHTGKVVRWVIKNYAMVGISIGGGDHVPEGAYLASYDPDAHEGIGYADWTLDIRKAMKFVTGDAAMQCYRQQSVKKPLRGDGKPNRPLTAHTVEIVDVVVDDG